MQLNYTIEQKTTQSSKPDIFRARARVSSYSYIIDSDSAAAVAV
jgi:hypothetical protein